MDLSIFEMFGNLFKYIFSSFSTSFILFVFICSSILLILNIKYKNKLLDFILVGVYIGTIFGIIISNFEPVYFLFHSFFRMIIKAFYFPPPILYISSVLFIIFINIYSIFSKDLLKYRKIINYIFCNIIYFVFFLFLIVITKCGISLKDVSALYYNEFVVSFVRIGNLFFIIWFVTKIIDYLYNYIKNNYI